MISNKTSDLLQDIFETHEFNLYQIFLIYEFACKETGITAILNKHYTIQSLYNDCMANMILMFPELERNDAFDELWKNTLTIFEDSNFPVLYEIGKQEQKAIYNHYKQQIDEYIRDKVKKLDKNHKFLLYAFLIDHPENGYELDDRWKLNFEHLIEPIVNVREIHLDLRNFLINLGIAHKGYSISSSGKTSGIDYSYPYYFKEICEVLIDIIKKEIDLDVTQLKETQKKKDTENIKKMIQFEYNNGRPPTEREMVKNLNFRIFDSEYYKNLIEWPAKYDQAEIPIIEKKSEEVLKKFDNPSLYDLIINLDLDFFMAKKIEKYLKGKNLIMSLPTLPEKKEAIEYISEPQEIPEAKKPKIDVFRGGDWKIEGDQSVFYYKVKVKNVSNLVIPNIQIFLTSVPRGLEVLSDKYKIEYLRPNSYESPTFKLRAKESCVGDVIQALVTYIDPSGREDLSIPVEPFEIKYVCNLLVPEKVTPREFEQKTSLMEEQKIILDCDISPLEVERILSPLLIRNNFFLLQQMEDTQDEQYRIINAFARGLYDQKDVGLSVVMQKQEHGTTLVIKAMSDIMEKLMDILSHISGQCDEIKSNTELLKEYVPRIDEIFAKLGTLDNIEQYLKEHLATDWEKIKDAWNKYKAKTILLRDFLGILLKISGKKAIKHLIEKFI